MRMFGRVCGSWLGAAMLTLVIAGCSDASKNRWNNFWGLDQPEERQPVAKSRRDRNAKARPKKVARSDSPKSAKTPGEDSQSAEVERKVDDYVAAMPPREGRSYADDDLTSKIERQQDPNRRRRIKNAAATRSPSAQSGGDAVALRGSEQTGAATPGSRSQTGRSPVRQMASIEKPPPIPAESRRSLPRSVGSDREPTGSTPGVGDQPRDGAGDLPGSPELEDRGATNVGDGDLGRRSGSEGRSTDPVADAPVLKKVSVTAAPEPAITKKPTRASTRLETNKPAIQVVQPMNSFAIDLAKQAELVREDPNNIEEQYRLRMMYLIGGEDEKALEPVAGINVDIQEIIQAQIRALISARSSSGRDPATWANRQLSSIEDLRRRMRARADLLIPKVVLCTAIEGFGRYDPIEPAEFPAGRKNLVLIYIEVDNFTSTKTSSGMYRTLLSVRQHLLTRDGQEMWSKRDENIEDLARQQRRDFYLTIGPIAIPKALAPGEYSLKVEVEDMLAGKLNSSVAKFKIVP